MVAPAILSQALLCGLGWGGIYGLIASGMTLIFAVTKHINAAHGDFMLITMYGCLALFTAFELDPYISMFVTIPIMFGMGLLVFRFLFRRVMSSGPLITFQIFLGLSFAVEYILLIVFGADPISVPSVLGLHKLYMGPLIIVEPVVIAFTASAVIALVLHWVLKATDFGRAIRAIAQNPTATSLMGINVEKMRMLVFALAFVLLAISGSLSVPMFALTPYTGLGFTLFALVILVLGGMGNFLGAWIGALIICVIQSLGNLFLGAHLAAMIPYIIFVLILLFRPQGLFRST